MQSLELRPGVPLGHAVFQALLGSDFDMPGPWTHPNHHQAACSLATPAVPRSGPIRQDILLYRGELARCADLLAFQLGKEPLAARGLGRGGLGVVVVGGGGGWGWWWGSGGGVVKILPDSFASRVPKESDIQRQRRFSSRSQ